jgi:organic radical activating enzyme
MACQAKPEIVIITGGEPTLHDLTGLTQALHEKGLPVHLETCGAFPIKGHFDWITLSPKRWALPLGKNMALAQELKVIIEDADSLGYWNSQLNLTERQQPVWLNPEWSQHTNQGLLDQISQWVRTHGAPFRAGWQLHKCYGAE